jgi:hypothetical protein
MTHQEFKPHAYITLTNCGGIELMLNRSNDGVYYRFSYGQDDFDSDEIFEAEIEYDQDGDAYFLHEGSEGHTTYYLNEAMRLNY